MDAWGLHDYVTGVLAMTNKLEDGVYINEYDYETGCGWIDGQLGDDAAAVGDLAVRPVEADHQLQVGELGAEVIVPSRPTPTPRAMTWASSTASSPSSPATTTSSDLPPGKFPSGVVGKHSANTATALRGIRTRFPLARPGGRTHIPPIHFSALLFILYSTPFHAGPPSLAAHLYNLPGPVSASTARPGPLHHPALPAADGCGTRAVLPGKLCIWERPRRSGPPRMCHFSEPPPCAQLSAPSGGRLGDARRVDQGEGVAVLDGGLVRAGGGVLPVRIPHLRLCGHGVLPLRHPALLHQLPLYLAGAGRRRVAAAGDDPSGGLPKGSRRYGGKWKIRNRSSLSCKSTNSLDIIPAQAYTERITLDGTGAAWYTILAV